MVFILRETTGRLARLEHRVCELCEQMADAANDYHACESLDSALGELSWKRRTLAGRASALGVPDAAARTLMDTRKGSPTLGFVKGRSALVTSLMAGCEVCAKRLCSLVRAARAIKDTVTERIACALVQTLERLLCLLWPQAVPANLSIFSRISCQSQLRTWFL